MARKYFPCKRIELCALFFWIHRNPNSYYRMPLSICRAQKICFETGCRSEQTPLADESAFTRRNDSRDTDAGLAIDSAVI
jgi:hypothetical protein